jgi:hypothetical protein
MPKKLPEAEKEKIESLVTNDVKNAAMKDAVLKNVGDDGKLNPKIDDNILKAFKKNLQEKEKAIVNDLRPPPTADKAPEHPKPPMPFVNEEKEMLAPVNPHMDSIQMVKTQKLKQHAMEELAKKMNEDVADGKKVLDKIPNPSAVTDKTQSQLKKAKLKPPPPPKPKPPQEEEEEEEGDSKQDVDAKELKNSADRNKNPKAPSIFDPNATKVGPDGKALENLNKEAGLDKDCSPLPRPTIPFGDITGKLGQPKLEVQIPGGPCGVPKVPLPGDAPPKKKKSCGKGLLGKLMCFVKKVAKGVKKAGEKLTPAAAKAAAAGGAAAEGVEANKKGGGGGGGGGKGKCGKNLIGKIACFVKKVAKKAHNHIKKAFEFKSRSIELQNIKTITQSTNRGKALNMLRGMKS